ncbi:hypothetical protein ACNKHS_16525 [Shigella flexneri]
MKSALFLHNDSKRHSTQAKKLEAHALVDGLQANVSGITIDVAYRYFSTEKRKFIIADTRGTGRYTVTWRPARPPVTWPCC